MLLYLFYWLLPSDTHRKGDYSTKLLQSSHGVLHCHQNLGTFCADVFSIAAISDTALVSALTSGGGNVLLTHMEVSTNR